MRSHLGKWVFALSVAALLAGCESRPTDQGQQYKDGKLHHTFELVNEPNATGRPVNSRDFFRQVSEIRAISPSLYSGHQATYTAVERWAKAGADPKLLAQYGIRAYQMEGKDGFGNVQFTGYYTPIVHARYVQQGEYQHPIYQMPARNKKSGRLPDRASIYRGALGKNNILAYSNSMLDNFMMEVQGSAYVSFGENQPLVFFAYSGKNGRAYNSIGKVLIDRGEVAREEMSMQAIRNWAATKSPAEVQELLEQNPSFVFFKPKASAPVKGASGVPLIAKASVASDRSIIPSGSTLLAEVPVLDNNGKFTGHYQMRLMVALDVGGAIKGHHFDIYQGIGEQAGHEAGFYNHFGRVWLLKEPSEGGPLFNAYNSPDKQYRAQTLFVKQSSLK